MKDKMLDMVKCGRSLVKKMHLCLKDQAPCALNNISQKMSTVTKCCILINNQRRSWRPFLKFGSYGAFAGVVAVAGYASHAYTVEEVDNKTKRMRESAAYIVEHDASTIKKFRVWLRSAAMTVPANSINLYLDFRRSAEDLYRHRTEPSRDKLLPDMDPLEQEQRALTLVLDLDETLICSDWQAKRGWATFKRPGVDAFLKHLAQFYEIVVYSDMPHTCSDPIIQRLDEEGYIRYNLSRHATKYQNGVYYRDLSKLNRDPSRIIYVSGHALDSTLQPENSLQIKTWKLGADDDALVNLVPFLEFIGLHRPLDIRIVLACYKDRDIASEFKQHPKEFQRLMQEEKQLRSSQPLPYYRPFGFVQPKPDGDDAGWMQEYF